MERGYCSRWIVQGNSQVTQEGDICHPEGSQGVSHMGIWGRVFWGEKTSHAEILGICKDQHAGCQCGWSRVSGEESGRR